MDMDVFLSFPKSLDRTDVGHRKSYRIHPRFTVKCTHGTLFVFSYIDDLHFCHEAKCSPDLLTGESSHRFAFVFRWLSLRRLFHVEAAHAHGQYLTPEMRVQEKIRKKAAGKKTKNKRQCV